MPGEFTECQQSTSSKLFHPSIGLTCVHCARQGVDVNGRPQTDIMEKQLAMYALPTLLLKGVLCSPGKNSHLELVTTSRTAAELQGQIEGGRRCSMFVQRDKHRPSVRPSIDRAADFIHNPRLTDGAGENNDKAFPFPTADECERTRDDLPFSIAIGGIAGKVAAAAAAAAVTLLRWCGGDDGRINPHVRVGTLPGAAPQLRESYNSHLSGRFRHAYF